MPHIVLDCISQIGKQKAQMQYMQSHNGFNFDIEINAKKGKTTFSLQYCIPTAKFYFFANMRVGGIIKRL